VLSKVNAISQHKHWWIGQVLRHARLISQQEEGEDYMLHNLTKGDKQLRKGDSGMMLENCSTAKY